MKYAGADWIKGNIREDIIPFGERVADFLGQMFLGIYHLENRDLKVVKWGREDRIEVKIRKCFSTYDFDEMTRLMVLSHDLCIRAEVFATKGGSLIIAFSPRKRMTDGMNKWERMPTLEEHVAWIREALSMEDCDESKNETLEN